MAGSVAYISIDGDTYKIEGGKHLSERAYSREELEESFIIGRLEYLLSNPQVAEAIVFGVRYGETFIIEDIAMGYDIVVAHHFDKVDSYPTLTAITMRSELRFGNGQKVLSIYRDRVELAVWNLALRRREVVEW